ncbi:MAG: sulfatase, partial [bacterium]
MNAGANKPSIIAFTVGASLTGGLIGAWEAAALAAFDVELTTSRGGVVLLALAAFALAGAVAFSAALIFALARRTRPGRLVLGERTDGVTFAFAAALLFYSGYYLNANVLPAKLHPASLAADVALLAICWLLVRFAPPIKIRRRWLAATFAVLLAGAVVVSVAAVGSSLRLGPPETKPTEDAANLLLITMDTTRADRLGAYGGPPGLTPNLDRLAASGFVFERAYCPMPLTGPSHAALLTGLTPRENGVVQNGVPLGTDPPTVAEVLRSRGYRTGAVVGAFPISSKLGFARGFEFFDDDFAAADALSRLTILRLAGSFGIIDAKARLQRPAGEVTSPALRWLENPANRPFFLWVHYFDPHTPYEPPDAYRDLTDADAPQVRLYDGEVAFMDAHVGQLLATLDDLALRENTVVVAVADHGESLGEHDYYYDHGRYVYEPCM